MGSRDRNLDRGRERRDRKSTRLNSSHITISYAVFCLKKKNTRLNSTNINISYGAFCMRKRTITRAAYPHYTRVSRALVCHLFTILCVFFFFLNDRGPPEISPLSLPDPLPI